MPLTIGIMTRTIDIFSRSASRPPRAATSLPPFTSSSPFSWPECSDHAFVWSNKQDLSPALSRCILQRAPRYLVPPRHCATLTTVASGCGVISTFWKNPKLLAGSAVAVQLLRLLRQPVATRYWSPEHTNYSMVRETLNNTRMDSLMNVDSGTCTLWICNWTGWTGVHWWTTRDHDPCRIM